MQLLIVFVFGAIFGTAYDYIHVCFGVLSYTSPHVGGTSLVVPLEFGGAAALGALSLSWLAEKLPAPEITVGRTALDAFLLLVAYVLTGIFKGDNLATLGWLAPLAVLAVVTRPTAFVIVASLVGAIVGPLSEALISATGFFHYSHPSPEWAYVPYWLPVLWIIASGLFIDVPFLISRRMRLVTA